MTRYVLAGSRDYWMPQFETRELHEVGREWPRILVEKFEVNGIGERRYIGSQTYGPPDPQLGTIQNRPDVLNTR